MKKAKPRAQASPHLSSVPESLTASQSNRQRAPSVGEASPGRPPLSRFAGMSSQPDQSFCLSDPGEYAFGGRSEDGPRCNALLIGKA